jgi:hypothetical protein
MTDKLPKPAPVMEAKSFPVPKARGMTSCIFHIDELCHPPEVLLFEMKNVKLWRVDFVKGEDGFYRGPLEQGDLYAVDVVCDGKVERFSLAFNIRHGEKAEDVLQAIRHAIETWKIESDIASQYLPDDVRNALLKYLHDDASQIARHILEAS